MMNSCTNGVLKLLIRDSALEAAQSSPWVRCIDLATAWRSDSANISLLTRASRKAEPANARAVPATIKRNRDGLVQVNAYTTTYV